MAQISITSPLLCLPTELVRHVLSFYDLIDNDEALLKIALTCKQLYREVITAMQDRNARSSNRFIEQLNKALLPNEVKVSTALKALKLPVNSNPIMIGNAFRAECNSFSRYKRLIIEKLKGLELSRLGILRHMHMRPTHSCVPCCENLLHLALIEKNYQARFFDSVTFEGIMGSLLDKDEIEKLLEIVNALNDASIDRYYTETSRLLDHLLVHNKKCDIEKAIMIFRRITDKAKKFQGFQDIIFPALLRRGNVERAIALVEPIVALHESIPRSENQRQIDQMLRNPSDLKSIFLAKIISVLLAQDNIDRAIQISAKMTSKYQQTVALREILVVAQIQQDKIEVAIDIARLKLFGQSSCEAFQRIVFALLKQSNTTKAIEIAKQHIHDREIASATFQRVVCALLEQNDINRANEIAKEISDQEIRLNALQKIAMHLPGISTVKQAVPQEIGDDDKKSGSLSFLITISSLLAQGKIDRAIQVAARIRFKKYQTDALHGILVAAETQLDEINIAIDIAKLILDDEIKAEAFQRIVFALLEQDDIDRAIKIAEEMGDHEHLASAAFQRIVFALLEQDDIDKATEIAKKIRDEEIRAAILQRIAEDCPSEDED